jgi:hypothetical protein
VSEDPRNQSEGGHTWHDDTPFPRRWIGYVVLKVAVLVLAVLLALWYYGVL